VHNLTVEGPHTYHVITADATSLLVHNAGCPPCRGGRYKDLEGPEASNSDIERHHMPANSVNGQANLIALGRFADAIQMDIDNNQSLFGNKYEDAILEMIDSL
jgi:hypothetical protein